MVDSPEIAALYAIDEALKPLDLDTQARIANWLSSRVRDEQRWADEIKRQGWIEKAISDAR